VHIMLLIGIFFANYKKISLSLPKTYETKDNTKKIE
jgi:hypothetical protein